MVVGAKRLEGISCQGREGLAKRQEVWLGSQGKNVNDGAADPCAKCADQASKADLKLTSGVNGGDLFGVLMLV